MRVAIIGGGITGLTLAHELLKHDCTVTLYEAAPRAGGELATVSVNGEPVERFYHHLFTHDQLMIDLANELGLGSRLEWPEPEMAFYTHGRVYPFTSPLDLLRCSALSPWARFRLGLGTLLLQRREDFAPFEDHTAASVLPGYVGQESFETVFAPMLRAKFADHWNDVSMAWMWARLRSRARTRTPNKRRERLGYFRGSFRVIVDALLDSVQARGACVRLGAPVEAISVGGHASPAVRIGGVSVEADAVVATVGLPVIRRLLPEAHQGFASELAATSYVGACVVLLELREQLSRFYWTNIADRDLPFAGLIEHTNFVDRERYGGSTLLYLSNYLPRQHELFGLDVDAVVDRLAGSIAHVFPRFQREHIQEAWVSRDSVAQPVIETGYQRRKPAYASPIPGFYICNTSQIYPQDRGTNYNVKIARECVTQLVGDRVALVGG